MYLISYSSVCKYMLNKIVLYFPSFNFHPICIIHGTGVLRILIKTQTEPALEMYKFVC